MRVLELWRYPVKSLGGERIENVDIADAGLLGDRAWGIHHAETDTVLTARRAPELLFASARMISDDEIIITLPSGSEISSGDDEADAALSAWLGRSVTLVRPGTEGATYENPMDIETEGDWISWQGAGMVLSRLDQVDGLDCRIGDAR